ncbi:MAG: hypothetical protein JSS07_09970 [Proteobacteria bacterium]|nr:hypothetical protein [Pseudomonadota bacterium]
MANDPKREQEERERREREQRQRQGQGQQPGQNPSRQKESDYGKKDPDRNRP